ncbi:MAG: PD40 domain-containing protein [Gemmatimonadetes bacterium]|nr:PD40 domain-containing protein [Gemmatimonadota bacterium]
MMARLTPRLAAVLLLVPALLPAQSAGRAFTPADWYRVTQVSAPARSPDGKSVAFTVTTVNEAGNKRHSEVWLQSVAGGPSRRLTSSGYESSGPRWSDDGKTLYFTSTRPGGRGTNWALRVDEVGEAFQPTATPPAAAPAGSQPTDKRFRITSGDSASGGAGGGRGGGGRGGGGFPGGAPGTAPATGPYAAMPPLARPSASAITAPVDPARFDGMHFTDSRYKANGNGFVASTGRAGAGGPGGAAADTGAAARARPAAQLFLQRAGGERITLTSAAYSHRNPVVSPNGEWIVFSADAKLRADSMVTRERDSLAKLPFSRKRDEADRDGTDLFMLPVAACEAHTAACVPTRIEYFGEETGAVWSPDSKQLAFTGRRGRYQSQRLFVLAAGTTKPVDVLGGWRYEPGNFTWWGDGTIRMATDVGGSSGLYAVNPATEGDPHHRWWASTRVEHPVRLRPHHPDVHQHRSHAPDGALHLGHRGPERAQAHDLQRRPQHGGGLVRRGVLHVPVGRQPRDRGVADEAVRLPARQEVSGGDVHPRRPALGVRRRLVRRVPEPGRGGDVRALHQSARLVGPTPPSPTPHAVTGVARTTWT